MTKGTICGTIIGRFAGEPILCNLPKGHEKHDVVVYERVAAGQAVPASGQVSAQFLRDVIEITDGDTGKMIRRIAKGEGNVNGLWERTYQTATAILRSTPSRFVPTLEVQPPIDRDRIIEIDEDGKVHGDISGLKVTSPASERITVAQEEAQLLARQPNYDQTFKVIRNAIALANETGDAKGALRVIGEAVKEAK